MSNAIVIHRDRTFEFRGEQYRILGDGPGTPEAEFGYLVERMSDGKNMDGFFRFSDIYDHFNECAERDWPAFEDESEDGTLVPIQRTEEEA